MEKPLSFIIEKNGKLELNQEVMDIIKESDNPKFISFYGKTRLGKSTTLNQLIRGNNQTWKFINKKPFQSSNSCDSITKGCDIFGPIKISEIYKKHEGLKNIEIKEDFDVFFCDTEGIESLDGIQRKTIPGILSLLQICTISVFMVYKHCTENDFKEICSQIHLSKILPEKLMSPKVAVYISNIFTGKAKNEEEDEENEEEEENDYDNVRKKYKESGDREKQRIFEKVRKKYPDLKLTINSFEVVPGGPYKETNKNPDPNDIDARAYWDSIQTIIEVFYDNKGKNIDTNTIINYITLFFNTFSTIKEIDEFNLEIYLKVYLEKSFQEFAENQFNIKIDKIKNDIRINFTQYIEVLNSEEKVKESLNECFNKNFIEIYKKFIPDKLQNFINLKIEIYRKLIKEQIDKDFNYISENILSENNINSLIKDIRNNIINAQFKDDINMNSVSDIEKFWKGIYENNKLILDYYKDNKPTLIKNLKETFQSKIKNIFNQLISQKILWKDYLKDKLIIIQKEIYKKYNGMFNKCHYQEDIEKYVMKSDKFSNYCFNYFKDTYFKNISEQRLNEVIQQINYLCQQEYNRILQNKLPSYNLIKNDISSRIKEKIENYLYRIFNGIKFKDQVDNNKGTKQAFMKIIPSDIRNNPSFTEETKKEINNIIEKEVEKAVQIFNNKKNQLPLFNQVVNNLINTCTTLIDNKINELMNKFYYYEDKIVFNSDTIFGFLIKNKDIYNNIGSNINIMNSKLRELCDRKAQEYEFIASSKPHWKEIKKNKIKKLNKICKNFIEKKFENVYYRDDIKKINEEELRLLIIENPDIYDGVRQNKMKDLESEFEEIIQKTIDKYNSKKASLPVWNTIKNEIVLRVINELDKKSSYNLGSNDLNKVTNILISHIENIPHFFDQCKTEKKRKEIKDEIKINAKISAKKYIARIKEEERKKEELNNILRQIKEAEEREKQAAIQRENERQRRIQEEKKRIEEENRRRIEEENRRRIEEENRRRIEEENRRRIEEENRRRQMYFPATPYRGVSIVDGLRAIGSDASYGYRERIAARNGIGGYVGSPQQNTHMLNLLKNGQLLRP